MILSTVLVHGLIYAIIGAFAGLMSGVLGIGGGVIVVPGLLFVFQYSAQPIIPEQYCMQVAAGTSLAIMILTSQASLRAHLRIGEVLWEQFYKLWPGIVWGVVCGALLARITPTYWLKIIFSLFLLTVAIKMLTDLHVTHPKRSPKTWVNRLVTFIIGFKSGLLGVGGGVLVVPYLTYCGLDVRKIAAVSNLCTLTVALVGTTVFIITGYKVMQPIAYATGYVYWPAVLAVAIPSTLVAPFGAKLNYLVPVKHLKFMFIIILFITAANMLF
jgi:uncharacterized protein